MGCDFFVDILFGHVSQIKGHQSFEKRVKSGMHGYGADFIFKPTVYYGKKFGHPNDPKIARIYVPKNLEDRP